MSTPLPLPRDIDARSRHDATTLADVRRAIPARCFTPSTARSLASLLRVLAIIAVCIALEARLSLGSGASLLWQVPAMIALWLVHGFSLLGLFVIGHDCGHRSFSRRAWLNSVVGHLCMSAMSNGFLSWQLTHDHHHRHTQERGHEIDWSARLLTRQERARLGAELPFVTRVGYAIPFGVFFWIAFNVLRRSVLKHTVLDLGLDARGRRQLIASNAVMAVGMLGLHATLFVLSGFSGMLEHHVVPATIGSAMGYLILTIQHCNPDTIWYERRAWTPLRGQLVSTFDVRFPRVLEWLWCDINVHVPHHVAPQIPWYFLREATDAIAQAFPEYHQSRRFSLRDVAWMLLTPYLKHEAEKGYFIMEGASS